MDKGSECSDEDLTIDAVPMELTGRIQPDNAVNIPVSRLTPSIKFSSNSYSRSGPSNPPLGFVP